MDRLQGELKLRLDKNFARLNSEQYRITNVFRPAEYGWPGDWEGREILSLACLEKTGRRSGLLKEIIDRLEEHTNADGYFGRIFDGITADEQQLSGTSWFLRGLCEYYELYGDQSVLARINRITEGYIAKLTPFYLSYPLDREKSDEGGVSGSVTGRIAGGWKLSTDIGCAFIAIDGISHAYKITKNPALKEALRTAIRRFTAFDVLKAGAQTHATLTAARGILTFYEETGDRSYFDLAVKTFDIYVDHGMTLNYENTNWFGRPKWTEPCAVVDSMMLSGKLFRMTGEERYRKLLNRIYYNALKVEQRPNGGAGPNLCAMKESPFIKMQGYEAFFCCTMRLSEGLAYLYANTDLLNIWDESVPEHTEARMGYALRMKGDEILCKTAAGAYQPMPNMIFLTPEQCLALKAEL